jgi:hypothetical protein
VACFVLDGCSFLLQHFYDPAHAGNFMMHLRVTDADAWHRRWSNRNSSRATASTTCV